MHFLYEDEEYLAGEEGLSLRIMWDELEGRDKYDTIEHILQRNPGGEGYWAALFTPDQRLRFTNDIGGLSLTFFSSQPSNKPFPVKRGLVAAGHGYTDSVIVLEQKLARYEDWTTETIEERRSEIRAWALQRWHVGSPVGEHVRQPKRVDGLTSDAQGKSPSREQRLERVRAQAAKYGVLADVDAVLRAAEKHGLYVWPYPHALMIAPPSRRTVALFSVWPQNGRIHLGFWAGSCPAFYPVSATSAQAAVGVDRWNYMIGGGVGEFIERLETLLEAMSGAR